jgi:two-component system, NtrC family, nitrogen regulation sensor histidine kinase NtrY
MQWNLSLKIRIYLSMILVVVVSFVVIGTITINHFANENKEFHENRLKRQETSVIKSIGYLLEKEGVFENPDSVVTLFANKISELADINGMDINIYNLSGKLLISTHTQYFEKGVFVFQLDNNIIEKMQQEQGRLVEKEHVDSLIILSTYRYMINKNGKPIAIINMPYFQEINMRNNENKSFLITLLEIYLALFIVTAILAYLLSNYITRSIATIGEKLKSTAFGNQTEPLIWKSNDEIGRLVNEYNRMLEQLNESAQLLAQSERESAWREMAKQVAHEIKNPLTPMRLNVQHIERSIHFNDEKDKNKFDTFAQSMIQQIDELSTIASEFSNFAKMPKSSVEDISVSTVISNTLALFKETPHIHFSFKKCQENDVVSIDKGQLSRIMTNLIKNAIQAIPSDKKGEINILCKSENNHVIISINDNGIGMTEEQKEKAFMPNFTTKTSGMGLGLAICKNSVNDAKGEIWFESTENVGTTFYHLIALK